jgi:hypothetical protein
MARPNDFAHILNGVMWFQVAFASIFIGLRMYTRYFIIRNVGWDDVLMIVNMVSLTIARPIPPASKRWRASHIEMNKSEPSFAAIHHTPLAELQRMACHCAHSV